MKANEFVKLRGISYCKNLLIKADGCAAIQAREDNSRVSVDDLKRLVESHELVGRYGTADEAKEYLPMLRMDSYDELKQAIADVESCMEVNDAS